jgi:hypothetical protein
MTTIGTVVGPVNLPRGVGDVADVTERDAPSALLPTTTDELALTGDAGAMIAALLLKASHQARVSARETKKAAMEAQDAAEKSALDEKRAAAEQKLYGGLVAGGCTIASGGLTIAGGCGAATDGIMNGAAKAAEGSGQSFSALAGFWAAKHENAASQAEHVAAQAKRHVESAADDEKDARDLMNKVLDFYKEYSQAKLDSQKAALLRA